MPRLARKNIKVFAGSATNNGVFGSLQANNPTITSDVEQLQSLSAWGKGWNAATETSEELPPLEEIQGVEYVTTYQQAYIMQEGIPEWAATVTYYKGCLAKEVTSTGFRIYNSLTDNNTGNLLSDTSNWKKVIDSDDLYAFDSTVVHDTGNETVAGVKTFTSSPLVPTPSSGDNSQKAATTAFVKAQGYADDSSVVHKTGSETIAGVKTFSSSPRVPTEGIEDSSTRAASTAFVHNLLSRVYPVGSIYIGTTDYCPLQYLIDGSTWMSVAKNCTLWGNDTGLNAGRTIEAGLPNITATGTIGTIGSHAAPTISGAFVNLRNGSIGSDEPNTTGWLYDLDASKSNSIYGKSSTVQPPAYVVNIWQRTV